MAGGINVAAKQKIRYPTFSIEEVLSKRPDVILITSMRSPETVSASLAFWKRWKGLPAVEKRRIHLIDSDLIDRPSPRIVQGLEEMARLIHPEIKEMIENQK
jgi:iron complex transport system substrate-binding protein